MSQPAAAEFALQGDINGTPISPAHVPFGLMRRFHEEGGILGRQVFGECAIG